jgi:hypothetical protein
MQQLQRHEKDQKDNPFSLHPTNPLSINDDGQNRQDQVDQTVMEGAAIID